jgi:hypothetical protein
MEVQIRVKENTKLFNQICTLNINGTKYSQTL